MKIFGYYLLSIFLISVFIFYFTKSRPKTSTTPLVKPGNLDLDTPVINKDIPLKSTLDCLTRNTTAFARTAVSELAFNSKNYSKAFKLLDKKDEELNSTEQWQLAFLYLHGYGTKREYAKAKKWLEKSATSSNPRGTALLGYLYEKGLGVQQNFSEAIAYYEKAIQYDDPMAMNNLGFLNQYGLGLKKNKEKALQLYKKAADMGWALAENNLGWMYLLEDKQKTTVDKALKLITAAADKNERLAMQNLNKIYRDGIGVPIDIAKADEWAHREDLFNCDLEEITSI